MKARLVGALILLPSLVLADATSDAFNTGAEFGKGNKGQGTSSLKNPDAVTGDILVIPQTRRKVVTTAA